MTVAQLMFGFHFSLASKLDFLELDTCCPQVVSFVSSCFQYILFNFYKPQLITDVATN